ncbi:hypothetical protein HGRIS_004429 [Hohenbuehelia grisea]|uniref:Uncharacterized protein n=1 Tax=Hohenbuehelia grisea TaxID=104357 RepID=A0ABR3JCM3_9AGAR
MCGVGAAVCGDAIFHADTVYLASFCHGPRLRDFQRFKSKAMSSELLLEHSAMPAGQPAHRCGPAFFQTLSNPVSTESQSRPNPTQGPALSLQWPQQQCCLISCSRPLRYLSQTLSHPSS